MHHKHSNEHEDKDQQSAENLRVGVPASGMCDEDLPVASEEEQAIADMISEGSPVVPPRIVGKKAPSTPRRPTR